MGREKKVAAGVPPGNQAKERHKRDRRQILDWSQPLPPGLVAKPAQPKSKHHSYFEFVENKDKKKKLEIEVTTNREPPPGFEFVPIGNPDLTTACKELSREKDAMIFVVSSAKSKNDKDLNLQLNRIGHHIRQAIVEEARVSLGELDDDVPMVAGSHLPEPIPKTQRAINDQADAAIRDLFPKIPNTDRQLIIEHAFRQGTTHHGTPVVGLAKDLSLSRRVQLAVLAHIRHNHTRYDELLRETTYVNARKAVESLCLDYIVKWRGDEETGRDQLDEILREVIVISDTEDDEDDAEGGEGADSDDDASVQEVDRDEVVFPPGRPLPRRLVTPGDDQTLVTAHMGHTRVRSTDSLLISSPRPRRKKQERRKDKKAQRGFQRYQAVRDKVWHDAIARQRREDDDGAAGSALQGLITGPVEYWHPVRRTEPPLLAGASDRRSPRPGFQVQPSPNRDSAPPYQDLRHYDQGIISSRGENIPIPISAGPPPQVEQPFIGDSGVPFAERAKVGTRPAYPDAQRHPPHASRDPSALKDWLVMSTEPRSPGAAGFMSHGVPALHRPPPSQMESSSLPRPDTVPNADHIGLVSSRPAAPAFYDLTAAGPSYRTVSGPRPHPSSVEGHTQNMDYLSLRSRSVARRPSSPEIIPAAPRLIETRRSARLAAREDGHPDAAGMVHRSPDSGMSPSGIIQVSNMFPRRYRDSVTARRSEAPPVWHTPPQYSVQRTERFAEPVYREVSAPGAATREERVVALEYVQPSFVPALHPAGQARVSPHGEPYLTRAAAPNPPGRQRVVYME